MVVFLALGYLVAGFDKRMMNLTESWFKPVGSADGRDMPTKQSPKQLIDSLEAMFANTLNNNKK